MSDEYAVIDGIVAVAAQIVQVELRNDDDGIDRLNHRYTVIIFVVFAAVVTTTQYVGDPIHCWCPAYFTDSHKEYTNNVCWISNTYYQPTDTVPGPQGYKSHISYYQWVPIVLLIQASLFYLPSVFWQVFSERSGININNLVEAAETIQNALYPERRDKTIKYMIRHLDHFLDYQREYRGGCCVAFKHCLARRLCLICGNRYGNYLLTLYMTTKVLYFGNVIFQLFIMNLFLGTNYHLYGIDVLKEIISGSMRNVGSVRFPRVTLCDFEIRQMGNIHPHTVQCVLPVNLFNEKIFIFLWFWFAFVATATAFSFMRWLWTIGFRYSRIRYVRKHLKVMDKLNRDSDRDRKLSYKFAEMYLRQDGVFVLKLVAKNSTDLVVADIVAALWDNYRNKPMNGGHAVEMDADDGGGGGGGVDAG